MADEERPKKPPGRPGDAEPSEDPDRAAILARRQRFIAIALTGLTGAAACDRPKDKPATDPGTPADTSDPKAGDDGTKPPDGPPPQPCLNVQSDWHPDPQPQPQPQPCLNVAPDPQPQPCLMVAPPSACLKIAPPPEPPPPQPCLEVAPPPDPKPKPCLRVRPPDPKPKPKPCLKMAPPED